MAKASFDESSPKRMGGKSKLAIILYTLYITFILISALSYLAEKELVRGALYNDEYESHLFFPENGSYGHYKNVVLFNDALPGKIDLKYVFSSNTLFIQKLENIKKLEIDCRLMYNNKAQEVFDFDPETMDTDYYKDYFMNTNDGHFRVVINTETPMEELSFLDAPLPFRVEVNGTEWWGMVNGDDITISHIPQGASTVDIFFKGPGKNPTAYFTVSYTTAGISDELDVDATGSIDEDGTIVDYHWDWGDGSDAGSGKTAIHTYSEAGDYIITLTVTDNDELPATISRTIEIIDSTQDSDNDFVPDLLDPNPTINIDTDGDTLSNDYEVVISFTDITNKDSDGDGWDDNIELDEDTLPNDPDDHPTEPKKEQPELFGGMMCYLILIIIVVLIIVAAAIGIKYKVEEKAEDEEIEMEIEKAERAINQRKIKLPPSVVESVYEETQVPTSTPTPTPTPTFTPTPTPTPTPTLTTEVQEESELEEVEAEEEEEEDVIEEFECPDCGATVKDDSEICPECGAEFEEEEEVIIEEFECPDCGTMVAEDAVVCSGCGAEFED